uniref:hypothetical protein n=1 Tax=Aestuariivirga sp. TaxID=2650926 RepID=UPI003782E930
AGLPKCHSREGSWHAKEAAQSEVTDAERGREANSMAVNVMRWIGERIKAMVAQGHYGADT